MFTKMKDLFMEYNTIENLGRTGNGQDIKLIEEQAELIKEICKHKNGKDNIENIADESADVLITLFAHLDRLNIHFSKVEEYINFKLSRLQQGFDKHPESLGINYDLLKEYICNPTLEDMIDVMVSYAKCVEKNHILVYNNKSTAYMKEMLDTIEKETFNFIEFNRIERSNTLLKCGYRLIFRRSQGLIIGELFRGNDYVCVELDPRNNPDIAELTYSLLKLFVIVGIPKSLKDLTITNSRKGELLVHLAKLPWIFKRFEDTPIQLPIVDKTIVEESPVWRTICKKHGVCAFKFRDEFLK